MVSTNFLLLIGTTFWIIIAIIIWLFMRGVAQSNDTTDYYLYRLDRLYESINSKDYILIEYVGSSDKYKQGSFYFAKLSLNNESGVIIEMKSEERLEYSSYESFFCDWRFLKDE